MSNKVRWAILGCGKIANKFASDLKLVENAELIAIASQDIARGKEFAARFSPKYVLNTYEKLVSHPEIDVIYIATPHGFHYQHVMLCLRNRKAVLCEKAFAMNYTQLQEMITFARNEKIFLMEAFWTKFIPQYQKMKEIIKEGTIGEVKFIQADFGFIALQPQPQRLYDPQLGGGSLLDIGIYPLFLALSILGKPNEIAAVMTPFETGVDEQCAMSLKFDNGAIAVLSSTFAVDTPVEAVIAGTQGRIVMRNRFHNTVGTMEVVIGRGPAKPVEIFHELGFGYQFEARHVVDCLQSGLTESPVMTHADSLLLMQTLDRVRQACGIHYPVDRSL